MRPKLSFLQSIQSNLPISWLFSRIWSRNSKRGEPPGLEVCNCADVESLHLRIWGVRACLIEIYSKETLKRSDNPQISQMYTWYAIFLLKQFKSEVLSNQRFERISVSLCC